MIATRPDGEILWVNASFEELVDYTKYELVGQMTWKELTVEKHELSVDEKLVQDVVDGERTSYQLQKSYRKKTGIPVPVLIHVLRHPREGDFKCFLVSVASLDEGYQHALHVINDVREQVLGITVKLSTQRTAAEEVIDWAKEKPWQAGIVASVLAGFLFGDRFLDVLHRVVEIVRGSSAGP